MATRQAATPNWPPGTPRERIGVGEDGRGGEEGGGIRRHQWAVERDVRPMNQPPLPDS